MELNRLIERGRGVWWELGEEKQLKLQSNGSGAAEHRMESVPGLITLSSHHEMCHHDTPKEPGTCGQASC